MENKLLNEVITMTDVQIIEDKAKSYKKVLEKVTVYPNWTLINGRKYYQAVYLNRKEETKAAAVFSPDQEQPAEAQKAHEMLAEYHLLLRDTHKAGNARYEQSPEMFTLPIQLMDKSQYPGLEAGRQLIASLYDWQKQFVQHFQGFLIFANNPRKVTEEELNLLYEKAAHLSVIHLRTGKELAGQINVLEDWIRHMKKAGLWNRLPHEVKTFYQQLIKDQATSMNSDHHLNAEDHYEKQVSDRIRFLRQKYSGEATDSLALRWPQPIPTA
ncbi:hypothetical protein [Jeotgalibacillus sp. R-1-5s-1]|uniref:hypothetical protein n=1 Tax=Jeotgalibacillus sp. R-1-5s-1 TaxID=2555897 RepID=UPI00106CA34E|nr:hypothetical protein [Jeotgalibacillus sp. R-1-5s-1]TFD99395.1 hypothetical protein E2491_08025 [Jeotgalibacillus sp. R-1-5s-1]